VLILSIRTDKPEAEIGLFDDSKKLAEEKWQAHKELSTTIHVKIQELLKSQKKDWQDIKGVVCFKGPGSFTGLRIGLTVANILADSLKAPIVSEGGKDWLEKSIEKLLAGKTDKIALPEYGAGAHITKPKK
jgi:tRNA threonylcarbamoyladenosine biosynthesis protein TsaB